MLDHNNIIPALQSGTIKAALKAVIINGVTILAIVTGKTFDVEAIQSAVDYGIPVLVNVVSMYYGWKAIKGRVNATETIDPSTLPWKPKA